MTQRRPHPTLRALALASALLTSVTGCGWESVRRPEAETRRALEGYARVEPGVFEMGAPDDEVGFSGDEQVHTVTLTRAFWIKETEVTQEEWSAVMGTQPSHFNACGPTCPVEKVSWYDALVYLNALSASEGLAACYELHDCVGAAGTGCASGAGTSCMGELECGTVIFAGLDCPGYRLPTEAEWEYAARAGTTGPTYAGPLIAIEGFDPTLDRLAWYNANAGQRTHPVGEKAPNALGLHDMIGNVAEWVWDARHDYPLAPQVDPVFGAGRDEVGGGSRMLRGGSWILGPQTARPAGRDSASPGARNAGIGLRPARTITSRR